MKALYGHRTAFLSTAGGAALGYFLLHPYTMFVYGLHGRHAARQTVNLSHLLRDASSAFDASMLPMGIPFAILGGISGLLFGLWLEMKRRRFDIEKRLLAVETLRQLMVTLAHHLLNAVQGIGGFASRAIRKEQDEEIRRHLEIIRKEGKRIEAVVKSLQALESVVWIRYIGGSETVMIDIGKELEERLKEADGSKP